MLMTGQGAMMWSTQAFTVLGRPKLSCTTLAVDDREQPRSIRSETDPYQTIRNAGDSVDGCLGLEFILGVSAYCIYEFRLD
jgi:hypothetical protein